MEDIVEAAVSWCCISGKSGNPVVDETAGPDVAAQSGRFDSTGTTAFGATVVASSRADREGSSSADLGGGDNGSDQADCGCTDGSKGADLSGRVDGSDHAASEVGIGTGGRGVRAGAIKCPASWRGESTS